MVLHDVRFAVRTLSRDRGFLMTAVLVLGLGIGVTHMFLTIVYAHTMRGLPIPRPDRVLYLSTFDERAADRPMSPPDVADLRASARSFQTLVAFTSGPVTVGDEGRAPDRFDGSYVSEGAFQTLGATAIAGRAFEPGDHRPGAAPVVMLGRSAWRTRYADDPALVGRTIFVNGSPATVVGVMPDRSGFPSTASLWMPLEQLPGLAAMPRDARSLRVFGRLHDGVPVTDARAEVASIMSRLAKAHPASNRSVGARVEPINERFLGRIEGPWLAFLIAGCIIVIVSSANSANLVLARSLHRAREVAVRTSLGASRGRIVRERLVEALVLASAGGAAGLAVSWMGIRLFSSAIPAGTLPYWIDYTMDGRTFAALVAVSLTTVAIFGLIPALVASHVDVARVLKDGGRGQSTSRGSRRWTVGFLAAQLALAVVLLSTITLGTVTARAGLASDAVVATAEVVTAAVSLPTGRYQTPGDRRRFFQQFLERVRNTPGVVAAAGTTSLPRTGAAERRVDIDGRSGRDDGAPTTLVVDITPGYFQTLALPIAKGRDLSETDGQPGQANALVNERFVERFLQGRDPLGVRLALSAGGTAEESPSSLTVVGVAPNVRQRSRPDAEPIVYVPLTSTAPGSATLMVRSQREPAALSALLRDTAHAVDATVPLYRIQTLARAVYDAEWNPRVSARLATTLTLLCVLLATVGLYAATAHGVGLRRQEFGIRLALGATSWDIVHLVIASVRLPLLLGLGVGLAGALAWDRAFPPGRPGLRAGDPAIMGAIGLVLATVAMAACYRPARRAARLDPVEVLRQE
jgi:predicted permease